MKTLNANLQTFLISTLRDCPRNNLVDLVASASYRVTKGTSK